MNANRPLSYSHSVVFRTTLAILLFGSLVGVVVAFVGTVLVERNEQERSQQRLQELVTTVERTASIAAYTRDEQLAAEVAGGLMGNRIVAQVVIRDDSHELARQGALPLNHAKDIPVLQRPLFSPFSKSEIVGQLILVPAQSVITSEAASYSRFVAIMLCIEVLAITLALILVVTKYVTRPIQKLSEDLHRINIESGQNILSHRARHGDEIALLTSDINSLIDRMRQTLAAEREIRRQHQAAEKKWRLIFENAETGIFTLDQTGVIHDWNPWLAGMLNLPAPGETQQQVVLSELLGDKTHQLDALVTRVLAERSPAEAEFELHDEAKNTRWLHLVLSSPDETGQVLQGVANDISEDKQAVAFARAQAEHDKLTGLLNRRGFERISRSVLGDCAEGRGLALIMIDLDGFKQVNDTLGHAAGDQLLITVSRELESQVRLSDRVVRLGGDEFLIMLSNQRSSDIAVQVAKKIVAALSCPFDLDGQKVQIGASVGLVYCTQPSESIASLLHQADDAMYTAKRSGKSQFHISQQTSHQKLKIQKAKGEGGPL